MFKFKSAAEELNLIDKKSEKNEPIDFPKFKDDSSIPSPLGSGGKINVLELLKNAPILMLKVCWVSNGLLTEFGRLTVIYGANESGETVQIGGLGFLFSDEGSGFWLAAQTIRLAVKEQDKLLPDSGLQKKVLEFFGRKTIREVTSDYYNAKIPRDKIASLAKEAAAAALAGNQILRDQIKYGTKVLAESVRSAANTLNFTEEFPVAGVGGMFQGELMKDYFVESLSSHLPHAVFIKPRFMPPTGALFLAYKQKNIVLTANILENLQKTQSL